MVVVPITGALTPLVCTGAGIGDRGRNHHAPPPSATSNTAAAAMIGSGERAARWVTGRAGDGAPAAAFLGAGEATMVASSSLADAIWFAMAARIASAKAAAD
jgi:hypothetical protein